MQLKTDIFYFIKLLPLLVAGVIILSKFELSIEYYPLIFALIVNALNFKHMKYPLWLGFIASLFVSYLSFFITYAFVIIIYNTLGNKRDMLGLVLLNIWLYSLSPLMLILLYRNLFKIKINKIFYISVLLLTIILHFTRQYFKPEYNNNIVFLVWFFAVLFVLNILVFLNQKEAKP